MHIYSYLISVLIGCSQVKAFPSDIKCGTVVGRQGRIINGDVARPNQFPWMASIKKVSVYGSSHRCGGTIISDSPPFILTAAHCFQDELSEGHIVEARSDSLSKYVVTLGDYHQDVEEIHSRNFNIKRIIFHNKFQNSRPLTNDILLLELNETITWSNHIRPICFPSKDVLSQEEAFAAGWGRDINPTVTDEDNNKLRFVQLSIFSNKVCNQIYTKRGLNLRLQSTQICAGVNQPDVIRDTNWGDSGGPLLITKNNRHVLVGITSSGTGESIHPQAPGIYTRVFEYLDWIKAYSKVFSL